MGRFLPWLIVLPAAFWLVWEARPPEPGPGEMRLDEFGKLPVAHEGRVKPVDSVARTVLLSVSERQSFVDEANKRRTAVRWLLDVLSGKGALKHKVFRVTDPQILTLLKLEAREGYRYSVDEMGDQIQELLRLAQKAHQKQEAQQPLDAYETRLMQAAGKLMAHGKIAQAQSPHWLPPPEGSSDWRMIPEAGEGDPYRDGLREILKAYLADDAPAFNAAVASYQTLLSKSRPAEELARVRFEVFFNHAEPFYRCALLYVAAFVLTALSWIGRWQPLNRGAFWLLSLAWVVHSLALGTRVYLSGYPPVTNLYATAIFIGWAIALMGLLLELIFRLGVGNALAATAGFATMLIAHHLSMAEGDTMGVMQAVLDTPFWLWTHVTCITLGYATTLGAGLLGAFYVLGGVVAGGLTSEVRRAMGRMIYGIVCFATFFSFVGTVLGGLWADDSWGRFWGWDPKENGALMIVLWNAIFLHARWGGLARERGLALLSIFGTIVTVWSWFGVNNLGVGLHAYGFTEGRGFWVALFSAVQMAVIGIGLLPLRRWTSDAPATS